MYTLWSILITLTYLLGIYLAVRVVMYDTQRLAQSTVAWAISLVLIPWFAIPVFMLIGERKFVGYVKARRLDKMRLLNLAPGIWDARVRHKNARDESDGLSMRTMEKLSELPVSNGNAVRFLVDGKESFDAMFSALERAREYILLQFYILRADGVGRQLRDILVRKALQGVRVHVLIDAVGSWGLENAYVESLRDAGCAVASFNVSEGRTNPMRINFRNHRKVVVIDGETGFTGGINVGDEYLGLDPEIGPWRDNFLRLRGPAVKALQLSFAEDWHWAGREVLKLDWTASEAVPDATAGEVTARTLIVPSGPADVQDTKLLLYLYLINEATRRLWIMSPYFVPGDEVMSALQLAVMRGVDVRIYIPYRADHMLVWLSSFAFLQDPRLRGVRIYRYKAGFLHAKTVIVDDDISLVGTANLDNRSFRINFEVSAVLRSEELNRRIAAQIVLDQENCVPATHEDLSHRSFWFRLGIAIARLFSPLC